MTQQRADTADKTKVPDPPASVSNQNGEEAEGAHHDVDPRQRVQDRKRRRGKDGSKRQSP